MVLSDMSEAMEIYERARKLGTRDYNTHVSHGENGHVAVLSDRIGQCDILAYLRQPLREITLSRVVGTYTASRAQSFATNFMPLLPFRSEFGAKWARVCNAHLNEGLKDAITVYEYMWKYYVIEGNKRVSVLKYFGAATIHAEITRIVPRLDDESDDARRWYAFLEYAKKGLFQELELSDADKYERLYRQEQRLLAALPEGAELPDFNRLYGLFESYCREVDPTLPPGDTFNEYLHIYGFPIDTPTDEVRDRIRRLQPQIKLLDNPEPPMLILDNEPEEPPRFKLFGSRRTPHIVFAYGVGRTETNWLGAHERGRLAIEEALSDRVTTSCIDGLTAENAYELLSRDAADADLLFVTTPAFLNPVLRFSIEHPECLTLVYSPVQQDHRLCTYFGRYYESVYLCGVAAGLCTTTRKVGYVTPKLATKRYTSDINAFAIGVRTVCRDAQIFLQSRGVDPSDNSTCEQAVRHLASLGADVVLTPVYDGFHPADLPDDVFSALCSVSPDGTPLQCLAAPGWNWDAFYLAIAENYLSGSLDILKTGRRTDTPVTGFWWGLGSGVINFTYTAGILPPTTENLLRYLRGNIRRSLYNPFHGPVRDSEGVLRVVPHEDLRPMEILRMEWLVDSITPIV
ncbi:MAG: BMP family ABC transporter substrate-binding protein [Clostridiaceae bacterium]|nr:BMP family ABC transporter substrate-binding protein [Clostridiaceae bacterium]